MFSLNGTLKKSGSVGRWETKQFIGMAKTLLNKLAIIGTEYNWLLFMICWIVRLYHRIGRMEEIERNEGHFGGTFW